MVNKSRKSDNKNVFASVKCSFCSNWFGITRDGFRSHFRLGMEYWSCRKGKCLGEQAIVGNRKHLRGIQRKCVKCGTNKVRIQINKRGTLVELWRYKDGKHYCISCYDKLFRYTYKNEQKSNNEEVRIGYCSWCPNNIFDGSAKRTDVAHLKYDDSEPISYTIELCASCHRKYDRKMEKVGECYCCGRIKWNRMRKSRSDGTRRKTIWYNNNDSQNNMICELCFKKYFKIPKQIRSIKRRAKRIRFGSIKITLTFNIRKFVCINCGIFDRWTQVHHSLGYYRIFPWFGCIELCNPCHQILNPVKRDRSTGRFIRS